MGRKRKREDSPCDGEDRGASCKRRREDAPCDGEDRGASCKRRREDVPWDGVDRGASCKRRREDVPTATEEMRERRLVLVLDLDHTLLHSIRFDRLPPQECRLLFQEPRLPDLFKTWLGMIIKLRPFVRTFLQEANSMYRLCIWTMGDRCFAQEVVRILDPKGVFFSPRDVISRDDYKEKDRKGLDAVRRGDECTTVILDDTERVWEKHLLNLVQIPPYHFFSYSRLKLGPTWRPPSEGGEDEQEVNGPLWRALQLLRRVHTMFFRPVDSRDDLRTRDVRDILSELMKQS